MTHALMTHKKKQMVRRVRLGQMQGAGNNTGGGYTGGTIQAVPVIRQHPKSRIFGM